MSRIYRALERLEEEKKKKEKEEPSLKVFEEKSEPVQAESTLKLPKKEAEKLVLPPKEEAPVLIVPPGSIAAEEFRKLKVQIFHRFPSPPHSILVTSAAPQEGKTMVAVNLAIAISQEINKRVILIDGDLRNPRIHFQGRKNSKGLSNYLSDGTPLSEVLINSQLENLSIIEAGPSSSRSSELIGSKKMGELLKAVAESGENPYIIIDSSPIISTTEPMLLAQMVDGVVLVLMADQTPKQAISRALKGIDRQKIIGVVLNQIDLKPSSQYSRYYRYYRKQDV
jgi:capsular exopolysaccharide synthesis family protein